MPDPWPPERRAAQAERIRRQKPWLKSTGPKTAAGKKIASRNALKHGGRSMEIKQLRKALKLQREFMRLVLPTLLPPPKRGQANWTEISLNQRLRDQTSVSGKRTENPSSAEN